MGGGDFPNFSTFTKGPPMANLLKNRVFDKNYEKKIPPPSKKNQKFLMGPTVFFRPIEADLVPQNAVLWFSRPKKRKSWQKIALGYHFKSFWVIFQKTIFF